MSSRINVDEINLSELAELTDRLLSANRQYERWLQDSGNDSRSGSFFGEVWSAYHQLGFHLKEMGVMSGVGLESHQSNGVMTVVTSLRDANAEMKEQIEKAGSGNGRFNHFKKGTKPFRFKPQTVLLIELAYEEISRVIKHRAQVSSQQLNANSISPRKSSEPDGLNLTKEQSDPPKKQKGKGGRPPRSPELINLYEAVLKERNKYKSKREAQSAINNNRDIAEKCYELNVDVKNVLGAAEKYQRDEKRRNPTPATKLPPG